MMLLKEYPQIKIIQDMAKKQKISVYLVGGFLRDFLLNRQKADFDFAVEKGALKLAQGFSQKIKGAYVPLDEERGCARVAKKAKGSVYTFDFADFRAETLKGDLARRDFTINTLSVDLKSLTDSDDLKGAISDHNRGLKDIKAGRIKRTSIRSFREDPLRMLRAFSLQAALGFRIELKTLNQIRKEKDLIRDVSYERIRDELFKVLETDNAAKNLRAMDRAGLLETIIPQIGVMRECQQGGYHHLDVWPHSLETVAQCDKLFAQDIKNEEINAYLDEPVGGPRPRRAVIKLAALLHDIGKPETRKKEAERLSFHGHENVGKSITRHVVRMLKLSTKERYALEDMVQLHLRPGYLSNFKRPSERMIFRFFRDAKNEAAGILLLSLADQRATCGPLTTKKDQMHHEEICLGLVERFFKKRKEKPFVRLINGDDLIRKFRLKPSPLFKEILGEVEEKQSLGKLKTKDEALDLARKFIEKHAH